MKLTANLTKVYKERFKEVLEPLGFIMKGSLFIRVKNEEIIQTINIFKNSPIDFTINIGLLSFSRENDKSLFKAGNYRLYDFGNYRLGEFRYNPMSIQSINDELEKCVHQFKKEILPIFEFVQTEKELLIFEEKYEIEKYGEVNFLSDSKLYINLYLRNYLDALKVVEAFIMQNINALTDDYRDEFDDEAQFQLFLNGKLSELNELKSAIESNELNYLDRIVQTNINNTKTLLEEYGYKF